MKLNNYSYVHILIRQLCFRLEKSSGLPLRTSLSDEFSEIRFENDFSHIIINFKKEICFTLSHKLTNQEFEMIKDIMLYYNWLRIGNEYRINRIKKMNK